MIVLKLLLIFAAFAGFAATVHAFAWAWYSNNDGRPPAWLRAWERLWGIK